MMEIKVTANMVDRLQELHDAGGSIGSFVYWVLIPM
jgi:hypothetical protein